MTKLLFITDTHLKSTAPRGRRDNYVGTILAKLAEVDRLARDLKVDALIHGGDLFDIPQVSFRLMSRVVEFFLSLPCPAFVLPGNHDVSGYSLGVLPSTSLGFLAEVGIFTLLREPVKIGGTTIYPLPLTVAPVAEAYKVPEDGVSIIVAHDNVVPSPVHPVIPHLVMTPNLSNADLVLLGHWHPGWPEPIKLGQTIYVNPGSLVRTDRGDSSKDRKVSAAYIVVESGNINVEHIPLTSAQPYEKVFLPLNNDTIVDVRSLVGRFNISGANAPDAFAILETTASKEIIAVVRETLKDVSRDSMAPVSWPNDPAIITELELEGFQSHVHTRLKLQPGLNVIVGRSESGKSALIRAVRWLFHDKPKGASWVNIGCKRQQVRAHFADGSVLARSRTRTSTGKYVLTYPNGETITLIGVKNFPPPEIQSVHRSPLLSLAGEEASILIANQFDPPFLIGWPGSKVAAILDEAARNDLALEVVREMRRRGDEAVQRAEAIEAHIDSLKAQIAAAESIEVLEPQVRSLAEDLRLLKEKSRRLEELKQARDRYFSLLSAEDELSGADVDGFLAALKNLVAEVGEREKEATERYLKLKGTVAKHNDIAKRTTAVLSRVSSSLAVLPGAAQSYASMLAEAGLCPLCGSSWNGEQEAEHILKEGQQMQHNLQEAKESLMSTNNIDVSDLEKALAQLKSQKTSFEKALTEAEATLALIQEHAKEMEEFEKECLENHGVHPSALEQEISSLAEEICDQIEQLADALRALEKQHSSLVNTLAAAQTGRSDK